MQNRSSIQKNLSQGIRVKRLNDKEKLEAFNMIKDIVDIWVKESSSKDDFKLTDEAELLYGIYQIADDEFSPQQLKKEEQIEAVMKEKEANKSEFIEDDGVIVCEECGGVDECTDDCQCKTCDERNNGDELDVTGEE